ncbi:hypothetical protein DFJ58DRAFT_635208, partial [Suillus subalutaceus]|uniref:uncharacterized protein n=1 Tax=Suillus subalutaceus TaxID=48586 RepID=UPI001B86BC4D
MSIAARLDDAHEVATKLSSEHTPSPDSESSLIFPTITNFNSSNPSHSTCTCFSLGHVPSVRFAPLPPPDPNRKRSKLPLGVAARSRRRRPARDARQGRSSWTSDPAADPLLEDPLITLGKFVKNTTKSLWRRVRER